jgi:hypothetical protein
MLFGTHKPLLQGFEPFTQHTLGCLGCGVVVEVGKVKAVMPIWHSSQDDKSIALVQFSPIEFL